MQNQSNQTVPTLAECEAFCKWKSSYIIEGFVRRAQLQLPDWFVPTAYGVAILAPSFVCKLGYCPSCFTPRGWPTRTKLDGYEKWTRNGRSLVRRCGDLFSVERSLSKVNLHGGVLVCGLKSIPVFTHTAQEAMFLLHLDKVPSDFHWVELCPWADPYVQYKRVTSPLHPPRKQARRRSGVSLSRTFS